MTIVSATVDEALTSWQPEGVTILEGEPNGRGFTLIEREWEGQFFGAYLFACDPARTTYYLEHNELLFVLEGEVEISLDDGSKVELGPGGFAFLPRGQMSHWWFKTPFKEYAIVVSGD
jgi:uncharacterized cupin superfamily protein